MRSKCLKKQPGSALPRGFFLWAAGLFFFGYRLTRLPTVTLGLPAAPLRRWVCQLGKGFFMRLLRAVQPMMRLGVGVVACCPPEEIGKPSNMRPILAPPVARGFCLGPCGNQASAAPVMQRAGRPTSAELPATSLMDVAGWQGPPLPLRRMSPC